MYNTELNDSHFEEIKSLTWFPWVGSSYKDENPKMLIVGESNYEWGNNSQKYLEDAKFNRFTIKWRIDREKTDAKILSNIEKALFGQTTTSVEESRNLWKKCSYYNLIQKAMKDKKTRPLENDYKEGWEVFFSVIEVLKPNYVLLCSTTALNKYKEQFNAEMLKNSYSQVEIKQYEKVGNINAGYVKIQKGDYVVKILFIRQASSFFSWTRWHEYIKKYFSDYVARLKTEKIH